jgi:hypothetical protein
MFDIELLVLVIRLLDLLVPLDSTMGVWDIGTLIRVVLCQGTFISWDYPLILPSEYFVEMKLTIGSNSKLCLLNTGWSNIRSCFPSLTAWVEGGELIYASFVAVTADK